ncbi:MAG: SRPBCC family protein [Kangiellaceae bacterium]|nr:SRPBCC family protein [Kangiellaceae bacterium]
MNKFLKVFGVICLLVIIIGLIIPNEVDVRRSVTINASNEQIHRFTNNLERWPKWSPWIQSDPSIQTTLGEIHSGVGASQSWVSTSGSGQLTLTDSSIDNGIVYDMTFEGDPTVYQAGISYQNNGNNVTVTWYMKGEMKPIIIGNYFALMMDMFIGDSFKQGLEMLKREVEKT